MEPKERDKAIEFAHNFYEYVMENINHANSIHFPLAKPEIIFTRQIENQELEELIKVQQRLQEGPKDEDLHRYTQLTSFLTDDSLASCRGNTILIDQQTESLDRVLRHISHETLHYVRNQVHRKVYAKPEFNLGYTLSIQEITMKSLMRNGIEHLVDEYYVKPEVKEFFSELDIVVARGFLDENTFDSIYGNEKTHLYTLRELNKAHCFFKGDIIGTLSGHIKDYKKALKASYEDPYYRNSNFPLNLELGIWTLRTDKILEGRVYMNLVHEVPDFTISQITKNLDNLASSLYSGYEKVEEEHNKHSAYNHGKFFLEILPFAQEISKRLDKLRPYNLARASIVNNMDALQEEWPRAFVQHGQEIDKKYVSPIRQALSDIRDSDPADLIGVYDKIL